ncbi:ExeA family protein [Arenicella xantha]|uniref:General secretion pathway protein A n=1 Tax=Arenicella xantha TaxID=644221 RepID=A0A395JRH3_9GAMM|nr:AAA family ATPase [Arenicella xantha]RBP53165.1 general secretion pathway protein A [Arenicella xantha]
MYLTYFGLTERPFSIAPDPHYLYMSNRHKEAMAHLTYGLSQGGCFIVLTGEVGTGKTTLCRNLLTDLPENVDVALILNANINEQELLQTICDELKIDYQESATQKRLLDQINAHLLATFADNRHTVLIIDEAQLLSRNVLEQIRLLTNLETTKSKLLQIILIGQPELNQVLTRNDLRQLAQRVTARYHLGSLDRAEIGDYVNFRLAVASCKQPLFSRQALNKLYSLSGGIPRKINVLADHALLAAYAKTQAMVDSKCVKAAAKEVFLDSDSVGSAVTGHLNANRWWGLAVAVVLLNVLLWWYFAPSNQDVNESAGQAVSGLPAVSESSELVDGKQSTAASSSVSTEVANQPALTTIIKSDQIAPGSVQIADEFLDSPSDADSQDDPLIGQASNPPINNLLPAAPRRPSYDIDSEFGAVLDTSADVTGRILALRSLALAWDVDLPEQLIKSPCEELKQVGVACVSANSWSQLLRLNRPAVLVLEQRGQLHRIIVFDMEDDVARVLVGENVHSVEVSELAARWARDATVLWRPGPVGSRLFQQGDESQQMPVLRAHLNQALSVASMPLLSDVGSTKFDLDLAQKVFALQSRFGIVADSKVGDETYTLMNELIAPETTPVLRPRAW